MDSDALALVEDLDAAGGDARVDLGASEAVGDGVIVGVDVDMIVDPDPAAAPLAVFVRLPRQRLQRWAVDLLEQLAACDAEPAQGLAFVELRHQFAKRGVDVGETVEDPSPKPAEEPALDDQHRLLDLGLVARASRPRRQNGGSVVRRHLGVGTVDLGLVEARLDDRGLRVVRHDELGNAADRLEGADVSGDPVRERLRPGRLGESEARRTQHGDEDLRHADLAGEPVDDHRNAVAGVIDKQPLARGVRLPHRHRQGLLERPVELAEP